MRLYPTILAIVVVLFVSVSAVSAAEYDVYEDGSGDFATIQDAIDGVDEGDTVIVHPGTYYENIYFAGKNLVLRSEDPENSTIVGTTIIDGAAAGTVVNAIRRRALRLRREYRRLHDHRQLGKLRRRTGSLR